MSEGFDGAGGDEQIVGRGLSAEVGLECSDGAEAEAGEGGDERVGEVALGEGGLRAGMKLVAADLVVLERGGGLGDGAGLGGGFVREGEG